MQGPTKEKWEELCRQAATEQDADNLLTLINEINRLLQEKEDRLMARSKADGLEKSSGIGS
jgi:hypothetical protein